MSSERENIESAIRRVQAGEISPAEATEILLRESPAPGSSISGSTDSESAGYESAGYESLAQLVRRLGPPPGDVLDRWSDNVYQQAASALMANRSVPPIDVEQWLVATDGELVVKGHIEPPADTSSVSPNIHPPDIQKLAQEHAAKFRQQFDASSTSLPAPAANDAPEQGPSSESMTPSEPEPSKETASKKTEQKTTKQDQTKPKKTAPKKTLRGVVVGGLLVASAATIGVILYRASRPADPIAQQVSSRPVQDGVAHNTRADSPNTRPVGETSQDNRASVNTDSLETFEMAMSTSEASVDPSSELLSLDALAPSMPMLSIDLDSTSPSSTADSDGPTAPMTAGEPTSTEAPSSEDSTTSAMTTSAMLSTGAGDDPLAASDEKDEPDESPQQTRRVSETAVELPKIDDVDSNIVLLESPLNAPALKFPFNVDLAVRPDASGASDQWDVVDGKRKNVLANIRVQGEGDPRQSTFRWTESAKRTSTASLLHHARLIDASGQTVYLRPKIVSDRYGISFDQSDAKPSWDLSSPIPPRVTRLSIDFDLPTESKDRDGIELGWIEPVETTDPKRTRGLAVLTPTDGETIAVGIRFDVRCTRKLSARVRTFGRLDSKMPWQLISRPVLRSAADQVTARATQLSQLSTQMAAMYSRAGSDQRRMLSPKRDAIEQESQRIAEISQRLAELESLCNRIETEVPIRFRVWVQWPDAQQDLLVMTADNEP
tara:strand:- start:95598 stop:97754 length:2157 start_codon:yes stop_codon:yes gene_type:complete